MTNMTLGRILVVDDDDWIISGVSVVLTGAGFEVTSACDGRAGLAAALRKKPDLIITDVMMPEMDGWTFVRRLRSNPEFALVPVLFLTSKAGVEDRIAGFQLGADDYVAKPVNLMDLPRRVMRSMAQRHQLEGELALPDHPSSGGKGLKGTLDQVGMATLLSVLSTGRRSGILRLSGGPLRSEVLVYLVRGQIYRAEVQGRGRLTGEEALQQLFRWLEGAFEFAPMPLRLANELNISMNTLLLQGARQNTLAAAPF
jgi:CheY-like chemotaxis protein